MQTIELTKGKHTVVDDEDFEYLNQWRWKYHKNGYAVRNTTGGKPIYMHRVINKTPDGIMTDHRDRNGLNNQRSNLRNCTNSQNLLNAGLWKHNTSGFTGVGWCKQHRKWYARIMINQKLINNGFHAEIENAVLARKELKLRYAS